MPVYNEDTRRVDAGLKSIWGSLRSEPEEAAFDLFILSDTSDAAIAAEEEHMWE
jgi:membrane glycosyltransferase